jgi:hypothetical protein
MILLLLMVIFNSCFLFSDFKRSHFSFLKEGKETPVEVVVPKKYNKSETQTDSAGNQIHYYYYSGGTVLYFAFLKDTNTQLQPIDYEMNIPKPLYQTVYMKGLDSSNHYWRETKFDQYKAGYQHVDEDDDGVFDSSINYFSLHLKR